MTLRNKRAESIRKIKVKSTGINSKSQSVNERQIRTKATGNPYARIHWSKAKLLFQRPLDAKPKSKSLKVSLLLHYLGAAGEAGLTFLFEAGRTSVFESTQGELSYKAWQTREKLRILERQRDVVIKENPNGLVTVTITKHGLVKALTYELDTMKLKASAKWDHKWRVVIFDVPEKFRRLRDLFRMRLKQLGLYPLQESVYVSPTPCFSEIEFLREIYGVPFTAKYLLAERIEDDKLLKNHFGLG